MSLGGGARLCGDSQRQDTKDAKPCKLNMMSSSTSSQRSHYISPGNEGSEVHMSDLKTWEEVPARDFANHEDGILRREPL